jgi:hypothetical protein
MTRSHLPHPRDAWVNVNGFRDDPIPGTLYSRYTLDEAAPLCFLEGDTGAQYRLGLETITTDGGSIPRLLRAVPGLEPRRFMRAYPFHDGVYQRGYAYRKAPSPGSPWVRVLVTQEAADCLVARGIQAEGRLCLALHPEWSPWRRRVYQWQIDLVATIVYRGLQLGGFVAWNYYREHGGKREEPSHG